SAPSYATGVSGTSFIDSSLAGGTTYFYKVSAVNANSSIVPAIASESALSFFEGSIAIPYSATHFTVTAPATAITGNPINVTVTAPDQSDNIVPSYSGRVHSTSTDGAAALPTDSTLASGQSVFTVTLNTGGNQTLTATDTVAANPSVTGSSPV